MKHIFDFVSSSVSKITTKAYSTSFAMGIYCLGKKLRKPVYNIYGFVRFADEIVDTFHEYDKATLLSEFERDAYLAIERRISTNPILNSFQQTVHEFGITSDLIDNFLKSMKCDLYQRKHDDKSYNEYVYGSAEVVGLMCLKVFTNGDDNLYQSLLPAARRLGAAFQKVNFLRDLKNDYQDLGRIYFPGLNMHTLSEGDKRKIEVEIESDFLVALEGIKRLPQDARFGVYVAFIYYRSLFSKIKSLPPPGILSTRVRIPNYRKVGLLVSSYLRLSLNMI